MNKALDLLGRVAIVMYKRTEVGEWKGRCSGGISH
jgi:hypothetical protein